MRKWLVLVFLGSCLVGNAQETLRVMQYNLLSYGGTDNFCLLECKRENLREVVQEIEPGLIAVNELSPGQFYINDILDQVLNVDGADWWMAGSNLNTMQSNIVNNVFYDSRLLALEGEDYVQGEFRDIRFFRFYYKAEDLAETNDTLFFQVAVAHLKAGGSDENADIRSQEASSLVSAVEDSGEEYRILAGDLNIYSAAEEAYSTLVGEGTPYADPLDEPGEWHNNFDFAGIHTQSTREENEPDDGASGGLDDRFDFILTSPEVLSGAGRLAYVPGTYLAFGNNGQIFNDNIYDNTSISADLADALYKTSDHLPVVAEFSLDDPTSGSDEIGSELAFNVWPNPSETGQINIRFDGEPKGDVTITIRDITGREVATERMTSSGRLYSISIPDVPSGIYMISASGEGRSLFARRLIIR